MAADSAALAAASKARRCSGRRERRQGGDQPVRDDLRAARTWLTVLGIAPGDTVAGPLQIISGALPMTLFSSLDLKTLATPPSRLVVSLNRVNHSDVEPLRRGAAQYFGTVDERWWATPHRNTRVRPEPTRRRRVFE